MIYTKPEWYTPAEVAIHNTPSDCWVTLNRKVFDLTAWLSEQYNLCKCKKTCSCKIKNWYCCNECIEYCTCFKRGYVYCDAKRLAMPIVAYAGKDISHWFKGEEWLQYTHPSAGTTTTYRQYGHSLREPVVPSTIWRPVQTPWWLNDGFVVGKVTAKTRPIRIVNTMTASTVTLEVCSEETIYQIMLRYLPHNTHMMSYTWCYSGKPICYRKTLEGNGIRDERDMYTSLNLPENLHIPAILIYFNDDLTEDAPRMNSCCEDLVCDIKRPENCNDQNIMIQ